jgi:hypothetical protein
MCPCALSVVTAAACCAATVCVSLKEAAETQHLHNVNFWAEAVSESCKYEQLLPGFSFL